MLSNQEKLFDIYLNDMLVITFVSGKMLLKMNVKGLGYRGSSDSCDACDPYLLLLSLVMIITLWSSIFNLFTGCLLKNRSPPYLSLAST